jgi:hypothetical protein
MNSKYECKVSDLVKPQDDTLDDTLDDSSDDEQEHVVNNVPKKTPKEVKFEVPPPVNESEETKKIDILSHISDRGNINVMLFILTLYIMLNTPFVKQFVFKNIPVMMLTDESYGVLGIFLTGVILSVSTIIFSIYF